MSTHTASVRDVPMRPSPVPTGRTSTAATSASSATAGRHFQYRNLLNFLKLNFNFLIGMSSLRGWLLVKEPLQVIHHL